MHVIGRNGFRRVLADFERKIFRPRNFFRKIRSEIRCKSHAISRAAACRRSAQCLRTSKGHGKAARHRAERISARSRRFRTQNFPAAKFFRKFRSEIRCNLTRRSMPTLGIVLRDLLRSWQGCTSPGGTVFGAFSRDFERKIFRPRNFFENFGPKSAAISRAAACRRSIQCLGTS